MTTTDRRAAIRASIHGIDWRADFHSLHSADVGRLLEAADLHRYRQPANANGSRARSFFSYLTKGTK